MLMFKTGYAEAASFHVLLCVAANDIALRNGTCDSNDAITHHTAALRLIKKDVSSRKSNLSDGFMAAVTLLAGYEV
jgi:hypothetical protein